MKKITLIISLAFGLFAQAQTAESAGNDQIQQNNFVNAPASTNATVFLHDIGVSTTANGNAAVVFINSQFWVSRWASADINVLSSSGALVETFQIAGVTGTRGMTTDGTNIYISNNTTTISVVNPVTKTLTSTITAAVTPPTTNIRYVTFDASLDGGNGGFWVGNFNTDFFAISMTGAQLSSIPATTHTATGVYGLALDSSTNTLYAYAQMAPSNDIILPISLPSGTPGVAYDVFANELSAGGTTSSLAGGIFISDQVISGQSTIIGVSQATPSNMLFGLNPATLSNTNFDSNEFSVYPNPAKDIVTISSSNVALDNVEMTDLNGRVVKNSNLGGVSNSEISVADLATGVYLLKIKSNNGTITKKLIIE